MTSVAFPKPRRILAALAVAAMVLAACGGDDDDADDPAPATQPPAPSTTAASVDSVPATVDDTEDSVEDEGDDEAPVESAPPDSTADEELDDVTLTFGGTQSSSSFFAFLVAHSRLAGEADGAMEINVRETGAALENISLVDEGSADLGLSGLRTVVQAYRGIGPFEGAAIPDICNLINVAANAEQIIVHESINSIYDLEGKSFAPGFQGTGLYDNLVAWFEILDIDIEVFDGGLEDIVNAMKDGRIVGFAKAGNGFTADASMLDVASSVPVKALGFSQEDVDKILGASPDNPVLFQFVDMAAGTIFDNEDTLISVVTTNYFANSEMPQDVAYRLTKAMAASLDEAAAQTGIVGAQGVTAELTTSTTEAVPLCTGAERYFNEVAG